MKDMGLVNVRLLNNLLKEQYMKIYKNNQEICAISGEAVKQGNLLESISITILSCGKIYANIRLNKRFEPSNFFHRIWEDDFLVIWQLNFECRYYADVFKLITIVNHIIAMLINYDSKMSHSNMLLELMDNIDRLDYVLDFEDELVKISYCNSEWACEIITPSFCPQVILNKENTYENEFYTGTNQILVRLGKKIPCLGKTRWN